MTVSELIESLKRMPQDANVVSEFGELGDAEVISNVEVCGKADRAYWMSGQHHPTGVVVKIS